MATAAGNYKQWTLKVAEPYEGMAVFFVLAPGPDPRMYWGFRTDLDSAIVAGRRLLLHEAKNEQSSRGPR